jgi:hypothetical protein
MNKSLKWVFGGAFALVMAIILIRTFAQARKDPPDQKEEEEEKEQAIKTPSRVSIQDGQTVITLDPETQSRVGITVAPLEAVATREQVTAPAVVLSAQELVSLRNNYVAALTRLEKARANVEVSQQEFDRLKALYRDNQNASQKALQSAQGTLRSDQADAQAARQGLALEAAALRQSWGDAVAKWVVDDPPPLDRVLDQREFLVQVTLPAGAVSTTAPETISLEIPKSSHAQARLISSFPRVDPRIQGLSFLYVMPNHLGLAPGLNLVARLPVGQLMHGVLVPRRAMVWWQGNAWLYRQTTPGRFARRQVPTDTPLESGVFVSRGFSPGDQIVIRGAQTLLSEEFRSQIQPED